MATCLHPSVLALKIPDRVKALPVDHRGYPIPWFVAYVDGKPDFRVTDRQKLIHAVREKRCFVCGGLLGRFMAFVAGPMCGINRTSGEPPSHRDCAIFSATACPFLTKPLVERRTDGIPEGVTESPTHIRRNPGVALVWITRGYSVFFGKAGEPLFQMGIAEEVLFYKEGRPATRDEIMLSASSGLELLLEAARTEGMDSVKELSKAYTKFLQVLPE